MDISGKLDTAEPSIDIDAYLARIDVHNPLDPTAQTLHTLVAAHTRTIPFENLDPLLGIPVVDLSARALTEKLVFRRRGGYCYEHNALMRYALEAVGFDVRPLTGRVVWMLGADAPVPARTHHVLSVTVPDTGVEYLVDVGFGGQTLSSPIRMVVDEVQSTRHEPYRIARATDEYRLEAFLRDSWHPLYTFSRETVPQIDLQVGSWYVSTHPESIFVVGMTVARVTDDARWNLRGRNLSVHHRDGTSTRTRFESAAEVIEVLDRRFGIDVTALDGLNERVDAVLDT